ncbi:MAG: hypothetical protein HRT68_08575 [Flavobacteriaceae bacterium]|nr:hypothetical protein [Flavobacteriaceae bacterium]
MKFLKKFSILCLTILAIAFTSCNNDDDGSSLVVTLPVEYSLYDVNNSEVMGTITLFNNDSTDVVVTIDLTEGTGNNHPAAIYFDTANENGAKAVTLNAINANGFSSTGFGALDNGTSITYLEMLEFDGSIKVEMSTTDNTFVAFGEIGQNGFTGNSTTRALEEANTSGVNGVVIFAERNNGEALVAVELDGTTDGVDHPVYLMNGSIAAPGGIAATLTPVNGTYGEGRTSLTSLDNGTAVLYNDLINYDGHLTVQTSPSDATTVAEGDIGSN